VLPDEPTKILAETKFLRLIQHGHWTYAQRPNTTGAIGIAAVTPEGEMLLVDQFRIPVRGRVIELPAGLVGDEAGTEGEDWQQAAQRELEEEVGYRAESFRLLTSGVSSAGLTDESVHLVLAEHLTRVGDGGGLVGEDIEVCKVPLREVPAWLADQCAAGKQVDFKVFAALFFLLHPEAISRTEATV
jgi:ADP-ribose pyrophosphatase